MHYISPDFQTNQKFRQDSNKVQGEFFRFGVSCVSSTSNHPWHSGAYSYDDSITAVQLIACDFHLRFNLAARRFIVNETENGIGERASQRLRTFLLDVLSNFFIQLGSFGFVDFLVPFPLRAFLTCTRHSRRRTLDCQSFDSLAIHRIML